jgi:tRNA (guanosine-2'-O-)-methyltransferase
MDIAIQKELSQHLGQFITLSRREKLEQILQDRTRYIVPVLEDLQQPHNMSAAVRSVECLGIQDVYVVEQQNRFIPNLGVSKGSSNWVTMQRYAQAGHNNTENCFRDLRAKGYRILVTSPRAQDIPLAKVPLDKKVALVFGSEERGVSLYAQEHADGAVYIPMYGFTESFNVSVTVAICCYELLYKVRMSSHINWRLSEEELAAIRLEWLRTLVRGSDSLERDFLAI